MVHLGEGEEEGEVAVDAVVPLQDLRRLDALPGGGELDQHPFLGHAELLVQGDQLQSLGHLAILVKAESRVHLSGDAALHHLEDLGSKPDKHLVHGDLDLASTIREYRRGVWSTSDAVCQTSDTL